jgi:hypothetical protein
LQENFRHSSRGRCFNNLFRSTGRFGDSIARQTNLWPGIRVSAGAIDLQAAKKYRSCVRNSLAGIRLLSAAGTKESLNLSKLDRIFAAAGRRSNVLLKIAFSAACRELSAAFRALRWKFESSTGNSKQSLEIHRSRRTFLLVREVSDL